MGLLWYLAGRSGRARRRSDVGIAILLGLTAGLSLLSLAGARRTLSAYPRLLESVNASTLAVSTFGNYTDERNAEIASIEGVDETRTYVGLQVFAMDPSGEPRFDMAWEASGTFDGRYFDMDRFIPTTGRLPDRRRIDEVAVNEFTADRFGLEVGEHLDLGAWSTEQFTAPTFFDAPPPPEFRTGATIVGIGLFPDEVVQDQADRTTRLLLTPAFSERVRPLANYGQQGMVLRDGDAGIDRVVAAISRTAPPGTLEFALTADTRFRAVQATRPLAITLGVFGGIVAVGSVVLVGQALARTVRAEAADRATFRALGLPPGRLVAAGLVRPALTIGVGLVLAVLLAIAASPVMPIGPLRRVEPHPGIDVDLTVLVLGSLVFGVVLLVSTAVVSWATLPHRRNAPQVRRSGVALAASKLGLPPDALAGLRFAFEPSGGGSSRSTVAGAAIAIASLAGAITFGTSLGDLVDEPELYGWSWEATIVKGNGYDHIDPRLAAEVLEADPDVASWTGVVYGADELDSRPIPLFGISPGSSELPRLSAGRPVSGGDEVVLGSATARQLGKEVGDEVRLGDGDGDPMTVVGIATFPTVGIVHAAHPSLGVGAWVTPERVPGYDVDMLGNPGEDLGPNAIFVRFRPGTDVDAALTRLERAARPLNGFAGLDVLPVQRPAEIVNAGSLGAAPVVLASSLTVAAMASLAMALAAAVRRRRRDLVVMKVLGFTRGQAGSVVLWQSVATVAVGLVIGLPLGIVGGRAAWRLFAGQLEVVSRPSTPVLLLGILVLLVVVVAVAVAIFPARLARRVAVAPVLRQR